MGVTEINYDVVCPIENPYEIAANCDTTKAGIEPKMYIIGRSQLESITTATGDVSVTIITPDTAQTAVSATFKESESNLVITGTLNDNDNAVETDELTCKGTAVGVDAFKFMRQFKGKEVVAIVERSDNTFMCVGWDGGLKLREWKYQTGQKQNEDFHGFDLKFENKTRKGALIIAPDVTEYPGGMDDLIASLT